MSASTTANRASEIPEPNITRFLFADTRMAPVWFILRLWLGYQWLVHAWGKWMDGGWVGKGAGGPSRASHRAPSPRLRESIPRLQAGTQRS